ncbi:MAG: hypothetical protein HC896_17105 [Bacteroidales bacterium]|nr:hypothetical protein [Bacteroidales bacterium]
MLKKVSWSRTPRPVSGIAFKSRQYVVVLIFGLLVLCLLMAGLFTIKIPVQISGNVHIKALPLSYVFKKPNKTAASIRFL